MGSDFVRGVEKSGDFLQHRDVDVDDDEKHAPTDSHTLRTSHQAPSPSEKPSPNLEARTRLKINLTVLLPLFLGLLVFQLDRMNLASALTDGFTQDIDIDQSTVNLGNQLLFMGIVVWEIPCNVALLRIGPRIWLPLQILAFGLVATLQIFLTNRAGFLAARLFLGFAESGYIPGGMYILSTWYPARERARKISIFFFGMFGGNALSPVLASGILRLGGERGLRGWQWLFLVEGCFTILMAIVMTLCLPASIDDPKPLFGPGLIRLSEEEKEVLRRRMQNDSSQSGSLARVKISLDQVWRTVSYRRRWLHYVQTFAAFSTWSSLTTYTPSIIMSLGFNRTAANALAAVGASLALPVVFLFGCISDSTKRRGATVLAALTCYLVVLIVARTVHPHVGDWSRWGIWTAVNAFAVAYHPVSNTWLQLNCRDDADRGVGIAMWVMSAMCGLMVGTQYFQGGDRPFYMNGLTIDIAMVSVSIAAAVGQLLVYVSNNKPRESKGPDWMAHVI
ncbi:hypothetical protein M409DRAFT_21270 [Zasmidium cellare ATCC 36951]|uniref:Major facilitator superfamily (MFS) profile domain-containing protein n=1 Tax=Zasmidium cellare ATCC 36951 TaxID=1080233 RepID=A0A6A6CQV6_ZASCE|nr:uncharacterized protein M409DRAFT_21270 [Zasmidium cellare ATCC 36951]KAF2168520.1 hypothetical protein M409DRAFT_21270 [Zasmidium cellare ATCC 36951]